MFLTYSAECIDLKAEVKNFYGSELEPQRDAGRKRAKHISLQLSHKHLWFPLTRQVTQGTNGVCVCFGVCVCVFVAFRCPLIECVLRGKARKRETVSKIVETLICHLTNHKGQSLYFWQEAPWEQTGRKWGRTGGSNGSQREKRTTYRGAEEFRANGLRDTDIISRLKWHPWLNSPSYH